MELEGLSPAEKELAARLVADGQGHLFEGWTGEAETLARRKAFFAQVAALDAAYPGGLEAYTRTARRLLAESRDGVPAFDGLVAQPPPEDAGVRVSFGRHPCALSALASLESVGLREVRACAFVLVAGGIGERLGYSGIKVCTALSPNTLVQSPTKRLNPGRACCRVSDWRVPSLTIPCSYLGSG